MKFILVLIAFIICANYSLAAVAISSVENVQEEEYSIVSISVPSTKITVTADQLVINNEVSAELKASVAEAQAKMDVIFNINNAIDSLVNSISRDMLLGSYDPVALPDREIEFTYKPLLVTYSGTLALTHGQLQELSTLKRNGNATLVHSYPASTLEVSIPVIFSTLVATYNFEMNVRGDTVEGVLIAWANDVTTSFTLDASINKPMLLSGTDISTNIGSYQLDIYSASISTSYKNLVSSVTSDVLNAAIIDNTDSIISEYLKSAIAQALGLN